MHDTQTETIALHERAKSVASLSIKTCKHGVFKYLPNDKYIGKALERYGEYSDEEVDVFRLLVKPGDTVIESGANIGCLTVPLAKLVGSMGRVIAFEPQRYIHGLLCDNLALNDLRHNTQVLLAATGMKSKTIDMPVIDYTHEKINSGGASLTECLAVEYDKVPMMRLDDFVCTSLSLIKVDVEGMEVHTLIGARTLIQKHRPYLYVENDRKFNSRQLISLIDGLGYEMTWHMPFLYNPQNFFGDKENIYEGGVSCNLICIPREKSRVINLDRTRKVTGPEDWVF